MSKLSKQITKETCKTVHQSNVVLFVPASTDYQVFYKLVPLTFQRAQRRWRPAIFLEIRAIS